MFKTTKTSSLIVISVLNFKVLAKGTMVDLGLINKIKRITIIALVQDDELMETLILKGGNAISLGYGLSERASYDLDFSMEDDFKEELSVIQNRLKGTVEKTFASYGFVVMDFSIKERPKTIRPGLEEFWGGYFLGFKLIAQEKYNQFYPDKDKITRNALALTPGNSTKFAVDISKFEFVGEHRVLKEIEGINFYVYAPELANSIITLIRSNPDLINTRKSF